MIDGERLRQLLHYEPDTGVFTWRERTSNRIRIGDAAGCVRHGGYTQIRVEGKFYRAHRLAWLYVYGKWPTMMLDHIDNDPTNNRISNLRQATQSQNMANMAKRADNSSGYKGVFWKKQCSTWYAQIRVENKSITIGYCSTAEDAARAYNRAAVHHFGDFAQLNEVGNAEEAV